MPEFQGPGPGTSPVTEEEAERRRRQAAANPGTFSVTGQGGPTLMGAVTNPNTGQPTQGTFSGIDPGRSLTNSIGLNNAGNPDVAARADLEASRRLRDQLIAERNPGTRPVPQVTATSVQAPSPVQAASAVAAPVGVAANVTADRINAANIHPIERFQSAQIGPVSTADAVRANAARIATGPQDAVRAREMGHLTNLEAAARGDAPSVAALMMQRQNAALIANQAGAAASARGSNINSQRRQAIFNMANLGQQGALDNAMVRAQEMATARGQLGSALAGVRGADINLATSQAGMENQANLTNAQLGTNVNTFNAGQQNTVATEQARMRQAADAANASAFNAAADSQARLDQQANLANQDAGLRAGLANQSTQQSANNLQASLGTNVNMANASNQQRSNELTSQQGLQAATTNATLGQNANLANQDATLRGQGQDDARAQAALQAALQAQGQTLSSASDAQKIEIARQQLAQARTQGERDFWLRIIGTATGVAGTIIGAL